MFTLLLFTTVTLLSFSNNVIYGQLTEFPEYFKFGSASAAYQVEGAWDRDGKSPNIWDKMTNDYPGRIRDRSSGRDAAKSYDLYKDDVQMLKDAGMDFYRFSISWARVMPNGDTSVLNEAGLQYYDNLINELRANGIEPMVTMYHWDLPQALQEWGGFTNPIIVDYFAAYAEVLLKRYGDRVKIWTTFNEPIMTCDGGYGSGGMAPAIDSAGVGVYLCTHHLLLANARVYRMYKEKYNRPDGKMGIVINCGYSFPKDPNNPSDVAASDRHIQFYCGIYSHPIFSSEGGYPPVVIESVNRRSAAEGRAWSRLPVMDDETKAYIQGTSDYYGLNYYTSNIGTQKNTTEVSHAGDQETDLGHDESWPVAESSWLRSIPDGLRKMLNWIKDNYNGVETIITENGWSDNGSTLEDTPRIRYMNDHLQAILDAMNDGCNVTGHTTWSIMDNFEWLQGYTERFGIYHVDYNDPNRKRTAKASVAALKRIIETRKITPIV